MFRAEREGLGTRLVLISCLVCVCVCVCTRACVLLGRLCCGLVSGRSGLSTNVNAHPQCDSGTIVMVSCD